MTTTVAISSKEGVVLASDKRASKGFFIGSKDVQKIYPLDKSIAVTIAGLVSDAEYLINLAKAERKLLALGRDFPLTVRETAKLIANLSYRALKAYQPYYAELLVAGVDADGPHVYSSDPSGSLIKEEFASSGSGSPLAYGVMESSYSKEASLEEIKALAEKAVRAAMERDPGSGNGVVIVTIPLSGGQTVVSKGVN